MLFNIPQIYQFDFPAHFWHNSPGLNMDKKLEQFAGPVFTDQMTKHLEQVPAKTAEVTKLVLAIACKGDYWEGWRWGKSNKVFQDEVWIGKQAGGSLITRLDLSLRRLPPLIPDKSNPHKFIVGPVNIDLPFDLVAARVRLIPCPADVLALDFGTLQQFETSEKRAWVASFTYQQSGFKTISTAVKNLNMQPMIDINTQLLDSIKDSLPINPDGKVLEWITMNGYN